MRHRRPRNRLASATRAGVVAVAVVVLATATAVVVQRHGHPVAAGQVATSGPATSTGTAPPASAVPAPTPAPQASPTAAQQTPADDSYRVVGFGDSVPAGTACACANYVQLVAAHLASDAGRTPAVDNLAGDGLTTSDVAVQLRRPEVRAAVAAADLVIVTVGANDFDPALLTGADCQPEAVLACYQEPLRAQRTTLTGVLTTINTLRAGRPGQVLVTGYWNVFLDGEMGQTFGDDYVAASDRLTVADNAQISRVAAGSDDTYVDIYTPFKGDGSRDDTALLTADGDHPNAAGHALIASVLLRAL